MSLPEPDRSPGTWLCDRCDGVAECPEVIQVECDDVPLAYYRLCLRCDALRYDDRGRFLWEGWRRHRK